MPRESVRGIRRTANEEADRAMSASDYERDQPIVEVRWSKAPVSDVQVVTRLKGYEVFVGEAGDVPTYAYGMFIDLKRDEINDLIRLLRRARDQAFGRDE